MFHIAYFRVSTRDQSIESQRSALLNGTGLESFSKEFSDEGISGAVHARQRPGFSGLLDFAREGDVVHVAAVDRLGRDALDVQATVRELMAKGVSVDVLGLGVIGRGVGELILAVLAQVADMERARIAERTAAGREAAIESLKTTGRTHRGKESLGRPVGRVQGGRQVSPQEVRAWRTENKASIQQVADQFGIGTATVKRYCAQGSGGSAA